MSYLLSTDMSYQFLCINEFKIDNYFKNIKFLLFYYVLVSTKEFRVLECL